MERVSSQNSIDDRLAYYKAKYGEDFQADDKVRKNDSNLKTSSGSGKKAVQGKGRPQGQTEEERKEPISRTAPVSLLPGKSPTVKPNHRLPEIRPRAVQSPRTQGKFLFRRT